MEAEQDFSEKLDKKHDFWRIDKRKVYNGKNYFIIGNFQNNNIFNFSENYLICKF